MKNITLEDLLQKHFGLNGNLVDDCGQFTQNGAVAYGKMTDFIFDLGNHVRLHISDNTGKEIIKLVDIFDEYEHSSD